MFDEHQRTTIEGVYAAGDVVTDLHQLSVAFGHAAIVATSKQIGAQPSLNRARPRASSQAADYSVAVRHLGRAIENLSPIGTLALTRTYAAGIDHCSLPQHWCPQCTIT